MSRGDRAEGMARLRRAVAEIEARSGPAEARAPRRLSLTRALDRALGGGLAGDGLHEIAPARPGDGAAAMGFALALVARFMAERGAAGLILAEDFALRETGALYGPGLVAHGLELGRLVFVRAPDAPALFQAMEEALRSGAPAVVVGEAWNLRGYDLSVSRRLLLAARAGATPALLVQASAYGAAEKLSSAAETRFEIAAAPSAWLSAAGGGRALPGPPAFAARLVKARLTSAQGPQCLNATKIFRLTWRSEDKTWRSEDQQFDEPTLSLPVAAASGERPRAKIAR
jgi:protein ImuA